MKTPLKSVIKRLHFIPPLFETSTALLIEDNQNTVLQALVSFERTALFLL